ncbi:olfactory receptor 5G9-like [Leptodactylus fuscus]|uniref:olfactory receptor 5G9-like n=1 Tax=Leptodactylus fuscus TaxID=238119 RepID=UPI003F4E9FD7
MAGQENNITEVTEFFLIGLQGGHILRMFLFCLLVVVYCGTICGNLLVITLVSISRNLHTPMYFFISQLSICDILLTTDIAPNMFHILLHDGAPITFAGCMTQFYFFNGTEACECLLLTVMSYDRYLAICKPLHYTSIMTNSKCTKLAKIFWFYGFSIALLDTMTISNFIFCGSNVIDHFFCDLLALLKIVCSDTFIIQVETFLLSVPSILIPTTIIIYSYTKIILDVLRISSNTGRQKAFSTCSSHLIVVSIFYGTLFSVYVVPSKRETLTISKILSLLYTVFTPMMNPLIYSIRNKDIKKAIYDFIHKYVTCRTLHVLCSFEDYPWALYVRFLVLTCSPEPLRGLLIGLGSHMTTEANQWLHTNSRESKLTRMQGTTPEVWGQNADNPWNISVNGTDDDSRNIKDHEVSRSGHPE